MEKSAILNADLLDIVFEGRNKEYGAYQLRRTYNRRLRTSIAVMLSLALMLSIGQLIASRLPEKMTNVMQVADQQLAKVEPPAEELPPPPDLPPPPVKQIETIKLTPPKIVPDEQVKEDEMPPVEKLEDVKIDVANQEGEKDDGKVAPPEEDKGKGIIDAPRQKEEDLNTPFVKVEIESSFPGGKEAWERFLRRNLRYPQDAQDNGIQGYVVVQFVVDREGNVSQVQAISGPQELRGEAERVIKKSGKWTPAIQNARQVPSYKKQPIGFTLQDQ